MGIITTKDERYNILWESWHKERIERKIKVKAISQTKQLLITKHSKKCH